MLDALATGLREVRRKAGMVGSKLQLDGFLENMLRSRLSRCGGGVVRLGQRAC